MCAGIALFLCGIEGFEVDDDGFLRVPDDDPLRGFVGGRVDVLVWHDLPWPETT